MYNQVRIAAAIHNLYSARGTIIQEMRSGSLKTLSDAGKALDEPKEITTDLNPVWQSSQGMGTALSIGGAWNPPVAAIGASVQLIGIVGQNFAPRIKQTVYAHDVEAVLRSRRSAAHLRGGDEGASAQSLDRGSELVRDGRVDLYAGFCARRVP